MNWEIPPFIPRDKEITNARKKFTVEEDEKLKQLVNQNGPKKWDQIAKMMPGRTGRQCRDRYRNYLIPGFFNGQWTQEEDKLLREKFTQFGPQWARMMPFFPGRSANSLKNRWNYFVCRLNNVNEQATLPTSNVSTVNNNVNNFQISPAILVPGTQLPIPKTTESIENEKIVYGVHVATQTNESDFPDNVVGIHT